MSVALVALLVAALLVSASCGKKEEASCSEVSTHIMEILEAELAKTGDASSERANLPTLQNTLRKACEVQGWDLASRQCILNAKTAAATEACQPTGTTDTSGG